MDLTPPLDPALLEQTFTLFRLSRMLFAAAAFDIAGQLADGPRSAAELAERTGTHAPTLASLMDALTCWGAFARDDRNRYGLTPFSQRMVAGSENAANLPLLLGWAGFPGTYDAFGGLEQALRTGRSGLDGGFYGYLSARPELRALYDRAMESTASGFRRSAALYDFTDARRMVDVGGGNGALALEILSRYPQLRAISYDLPDVIAEARLPDNPAVERLELVGGDALSGVPEGADVYVTSTVLRCFDDGLCLRLLTNIRRAMSEGARLVAFEMVMPDGRDHIGHCTADLVARLVYGGQDRTEGEFAALFAKAGLRHTRTIPAEGICALEAVPI